MMSRNQPRPTKEEAQRNKIIKANGCMLNWLKFGEKKYAEIHHITIPGKRLGHWYTIPLSPWYHRGICDPGKTKTEMHTKYGASLADGTRAFVASHHYTELELWQKLQVTLGLDDELPKSKRVPRRVVHVEVDPTSASHPASIARDVVGQPMGLEAQVALPATGCTAEGAGLGEEAP
jgi:hypothetical protein